CARPGYRFGLDLW
nr:immunoglobulin heavy chain junction region [Macaca mulatta]MOX01126.1 immunoglobulin heavy chain junction region [Macaca mulatta]MOX01306.1 immunoglobulin heavy chain junction region [Macaca mulatta]MOX02692.1 immunoglobulin heavy chain junction region [Macaca mulatta]MOX03616.1 immunoglobulin heavy chain junction region [Macaca mulatta]